MVSIIEFKKLMSKLSILTGKTPVAFGKPPQNAKELDYMIGVYYDSLKEYNSDDITNAFKDDRLIQEISAGYSLNVYILEKYIQIYKNRRTGIKKESSEEIGDFKQNMPAECAEILKGIGINVEKLARDKAI